MRTTLDLPDALLKDAMRSSRQRTKTAVVVAALQGLVRKNRLQELRNFKGRVNLDLDLTDVRNRL